MQYIPTNIKINLEWSVKKGIGNEAEDFSRATVSLFLFNDENRWAVPCTADYTGLVKAELPETLEEGVYSLELVWIKNDKSINETRCVQRTRKTCVFIIDSTVSLAADARDVSPMPDIPPITVPGQPVTVKMTTVAAPYGYDGLSAYETAVMRGIQINISEKEWSEILYNYEASEQGRVEAEQEREQNEGIRRENESARNASELLREGQEATRQSNENTRKSNEDTRIANEAERESEESTRMEAEGMRNTSEQTRMSNEDTRIANEAIRQKQEGAKNSKDNESRWGIFNNAEEERAKTFSDKEEERVDTAQATENQREAVFVANEGKDSSTDSRSRWGRFNIAEGIREANETTRKANETTRESNEVTRKANETARQSKETERIANEAARQSKEAERIANETIRQNDFYAFANRVFDGGRADTKYGQGVRILNCGGANSFTE